MQHYGIFKREHCKSVGKQVCTCQFTVPEVKIVFLLSYWLMTNLIVWTSLSIINGRADVIHNKLERYVHCMTGGNREGHHCCMLRLDLEAETFPALEVIYLMLIAFLNFGSLPFVIEFQTIKKRVRQAAKKLKFITK